MATTLSDRILSLLSQGQSLNSIALATGASANLIRQVAQSYTSSAYSVTNVQQRAFDLLSAGHPAEDVAALTGLGANVVAQIGASLTLTPTSGFGPGSGGGGGSGQQALSPTAVQSSSYSATANQLVPVDASGGAITVTLPAAPADQSRVAVKIVAQAATPNTVTLARAGSDVFNKAGGSTSLTYTALNTAVTVQYQASASIWFVLSTDAPLGQKGGAAQLDTTAGTLAAAQIPSSVVNARTIQTVVPLSTPTNSVVKNAEMTFRLSNVFPVATTQWRFRIRNYQVFSEAAISTGASFVGVYHGPQAYASGLPTAGFSSAPVQASGAFTLAADGSEYVSSWITAANNQITPGVPWMFSFGFTGGDTVTGMASGSGQMWYQNTGGSSAVVGQQAATSFLTTVATPLDIRIEYQAITSGKRRLYVGDSLTWGTGPGSIPGQSSHPSVYAMRSGSPVTNGGVPSATAAQWAGTVASLWKWQRLVPANGWDEAVVLIGTNDINASNLTTVEGSFSTIVASLQGLGVTRIIAATIPPRNWPHGRLNQNVLVGATTINLLEPTITAGTIQIGEGALGETVTLSGTGSAANNGYNYTVTATAKAHAAGEIVASGNEITRLGYNAWLRGLPGVQGCASVDKAIAAPYDKSLFDLELSQSDGLHPTIQGSARIAEAVMSASTTPGLF